MHRKLFTVYCSLITFFLICCSSTPSAQPPSQRTFYALRINPFTLIEYSAEYKPVKEIPLSFPPACGLNNTFAPPIGKYLAIELNCPNGQTVLFLDSESGSTSQPVSDTDSHFLAWTPDDSAAYLKVDSLSNAHIVRADTNGKQKNIPITEFTYDLAAKPDSNDFTFTFSRGMGQGSELWLAQHDGGSVQQLYADKLHYISFARYSPDGKQIAFIKIPDSSIPFTVGELWVMNADGSNPHKLADADAGHGFAANWSPDGTRIAFVVRENPQDEQADQSSDALISNIYVVDVGTGQTTQITKFTTGRVETPVWSPAGNTLAFQVVLNGRMNVSIADATNAVSGEIKPLETEAVCCPVWMRK